MFDIGATELLVIVIVAIIVIGPKDMPLALRTAGRWIGKVRRMSAHFRSGIDTMIREAEMARFAPVARMAWRMPTIRSPACSTMRRWSQVRYGSHSQPLTTSVSTLAPAGSASLAWLGKAAPPCPTMPVRCTASRISWGGKASMSCGAPHSTSWVEAS